MLEFFKHNNFQSILTPFELFTIIFFLILAIFIVVFSIYDHNFFFLIETVENVIQDLRKFYLLEF